MDAVTDVTAGVVANIAPDVVANVATNVVTNVVTDVAAGVVANVVPDIITCSRGSEHVPVASEAVSSPALLPRLGAPVTVTSDPALSSLPLLPSLPAIVLPCLSSPTQTLPSLAMPPPLARVPPPPSSASGNRRMSHGVPMLRYTVEMETTPPSVLSVAGIPPTVQPHGVARGATQGATSNTTQRTMLGVAQGATPVTASGPTQRTAPRTIAGAASSASPVSVRSAVSSTSKSSSQTVPTMSRAKHVARPTPAMHIELCDGDLTDSEWSQIAVFDRFYQNGNLRVVKDIVEGRSNISLRLIEHTLISYARRNQVVYMLKFADGTNRVVHLRDAYKTALRTRHKRYCAPFRRGTRFRYRDPFGVEVETTVCQMNMFMLLMHDHVLEWMKDNLDVLQEDMNQLKAQQDQQRIVRKQERKRLEAEQPPGTSVRLPRKRRTVTPENHISCTLQRAPTEITFDTQPLSGGSNSGPRGAPDIVLPVKGPECVVAPSAATSLRGV